MSQRPAAGRVRRPPRRRVPKPVGIAVLSLVGLILLGALLLPGFRLVRHGSLPNVVLASTDVGSLSDEDLRSAIDEIQEARAADNIGIRRPASGAAKAASTEVTGADLRYRIDVEATAERILTRGRQGNPFVALWDQLHATFSTIEVEPVDDLPDHKGLTETARALSAPPFFGGVEVEGTKPRPAYPEPGVVVGENELRERVLDSIRDPGDESILIDGTPIDPPTTNEEVDALVAQAELAVDGRVALTLAGRALVFSPEDIASLLKTQREGQTGLVLHIPPRAVKGLIDDRGSVFESEPVDARFEVSGDSVSIVRDQPGFELEPKLTARQLLNAASRDGSAEERIKGKKEKADFTTADARALKIKERVSTFTTYHACCEPRVANIHRIADIVDGAIVEPGDSFSLNDYVGLRTQANGFVPAPSIRDGKFVEEVGGGISQFATTIFNAIFFGGYDFLVYQPHSYYISRYPPGREATISTPAPDLAFLNASDAGVYIDTSYTETSITVSFYGNQDFEVTAHEGPRRKVREPKTKCRENESLARGEERVVQEGITGFDIVVTRRFSDDRPDEHFTTHYDMQLRIVEKRRCEARRN